LMYPAVEGAGLTTLYEYRTGNLPSLPVNVARASNPDGRTVEVSRHALQSYWGFPH
jgi:hypothetical protein